MWHIKNLPFYIDLVFCLILLPDMITLLHIERWLVNDSTFVYLLVSWLYLIYILNRRLTMPFLFADKRKFWITILLILLTIAGTYLITRYQMEVPMHRMRKPKFIQHIPKIRLQQQAVWFLYVVVTTFSMAVGLLTELYHQIMQRQAVEFEKKKAELALYKAQINPHFLFNTLNTLYGLLITQSDKTEVTLERFINLTKYMYNNANREFIPLAEEVDYIGQYIALQKLRLNELADVRFTHDVEREEIPIPPMMLITFVENAFKYGISSNDPCFIHIRLSQQADKLYFEVTNSTFDREVKSSGRMGIKNCRRRLELLYPDRHRLDIEQGNEGIFRVRLEIKLEETA